jgi:hypothetical protein
MYEIGMNVKGHSMGRVLDMVRLDDLVRKMEVFFWGVEIFVRWGAVGQIQS